MESGKNGELNFPTFVFQYAMNSFVLVGLVLVFNFSDILSPDEGDIFRGVDY